MGRACPLLPLVRVLPPNHPEALQWLMRVWDGIASGDVTNYEDEIGGIPPMRVKLKVLLKVRLKVLPKETLKLLVV